MGQMHTDADGSWAWNGSNWKGQGNTSDFYSLNNVIVRGGSKSKPASDFSKESFALSMSVLDESKLNGRHYFKNMENTFFDFSTISKFGAYGSNVLDLYDIGAGFYKVSTAKSSAERTDASNSLAFDGVIIALGKQYPILGITITVAKVISNTDTYKQGLHNGRKKAFIQKNGYPVNHTATIKPNSGMYRNFPKCPLEFK
ncbi:hypothetical protein EKM02_13495 [Flavobacterium sp. RSP49]|uniref:hypothetical protein n=1 Tax=Flavobacterium sp. RSP49 TaxID=2497487 RepID=UPI000F83E87C|nr:hypothetical protein [Flavobacterium sp. RSP49]RTY97614.1 hypothetical protein EKM02_13495 [Flavobacterium sp. RSP49]